MGPPISRGIGGRVARGDTEVTHAKPPPRLKPAGSLIRTTDVQSGIVSFHIAVRDVGVKNTAKGVVEKRMDPLKTQSNVIS